MKFSPRFQEALGYAATVHAGQLRKGTAIPYVAHLLEVTAIVLQYGGGEDEAIGALLHDAAEDGGGQARLNDIRARFGDHVAVIVDGCSDSLAEDPAQKAPWPERKRTYVARIPAEPAPVRLVSAADKLANARAILDDYHEHRDEIWHRFKGKREGTLWYYRAVADAFLKAERNDLTVKLDLIANELWRVTGFSGR